MFVTADPVFSLESGNEADVLAALRDADIPENKDFFVIAVREWKNSDAELEQKVADFAGYVSEKYGLLPLVIPMQDGYDRHISERIAEKIGCTITKEGVSPEVMLGVIGKSKLVLGMRLHTLIYAAKNVVPAIALDYDPKVDAVMEAIEQKFLVKADNVDVDKLCAYADQIFANRKEICEHLEEKSNQYKVLANKNVEMALELLR